jgi:glycogen synthase
MIVLVSFETEFSSHGGLGAVMKLLPREIGEDRCAIIAPFFHNVIALDELKRRKAIKRSESLFTVQVLIRGIAYPVEVIQVENRHGLSLFFLASNQFFQAPANPYVNPGDPAAPLDPYRNPNNTEALAEDALFFSIALPVVLVELAKAGHLNSRDVVLHLQDWETAAVAQSIKQTHTSPALASIRCVLTVHNPYDKPLHRLNSARVCDFAAHLGFELNHSVLEQVIPLLDAPVSTVSAGFAHELRNEPLYTQIFCPHLQTAFRDKGLVGIDNGIFGASTFPFSPESFAEASTGRYERLAREKAGARARLGEILPDYLRTLATDGKVTVWGGPLDLDDPHIPIFLMLGRDDPRQKGFDVMVEAIRAIPRGAAHYIFTVMPGDEGLLGLDFMRRLAEERPEEVCVLPTRVAAPVFEALQRGSSFLVMGSLYEPFGAANEGYLSGMPVVARATGGLVQQVAPAPECMSDEQLLSLYGRQLARRYHGAGDGPTGILYREQVAFADEVDGWRELVECGYWKHNPKGDRIEGRASSLLYRQMTASAAEALRLAIRIHADPPRYAAMIINGWNMLAKFQWKRAVASYRQHLYQRG